MIEFILMAVVAIVITSWFQYKYTCVYGNHEFQQISRGKFSCIKCGLTKVTIKK